MLAANQDWLTALNKLPKSAAYLHTLLFIIKQKLGIVYRFLRI